MFRYKPGEYIDFNLKFLKGRNMKKVEIQREIQETLKEKPIQDIWGHTLANKERRYEGTPQLALTTESVGYRKT